jgi:hypothetical protein
MGCAYLATIPAALGLAGDPGNPGQRPHKESDMLGNLTFRDVERLGELMLAVVALSIPLVTIAVYALGQ